VPQTEQIPWVAGFPFFIVTFFSSFIDLFDLHFTQYPSIAAQISLPHKKCCVQNHCQNERWLLSSVRRNYSEVICASIFENCKKIRKIWKKKIGVILGDLPIVSDQGKTKEQIRDNL